MKFKVGDKVRVLNLKDAHHRDKYVGEIFYIEDVNPNGSNTYSEPHYSLENTLFVFEESELELVEPKLFTKENLKEGMVVEYANGRRRVFLNDKFMGIDGFISLSEFTDTLEHKDREFSIFNIVKIYLSKASFLPEYFNDEHLELIWERKEIKSVWKPAYEEMYYYIDLCGDIVSTVWFGSKSDKENYSTGNCYKTKDEAELAKKQTFPK